MSHTILIFIVKVSVLGYFPLQLYIRVVLYHIGIPHCILCVNIYIYIY